MQQNDGHIIIISLRTTKKSHFSALWGETEMSEGAASYDFSGLGGFSVCRMIKIKSYVVITFCYRKANILRRWSKILHFSYGNKGLCHCCRSY